MQYEAYEAEMLKNKMANLRLKPNPFVGSTWAVLQEVIKQYM
jgi:hypothetical protein